MKRRALIWSVAAALAVCGAVGVKLWQRWIDVSQESMRAGPNEAALAKSAEAEATGEIVVAIGTFDHPNVNNRDPKFPLEIAAYLRQAGEKNLVFVQRLLGEPVDKRPAQWILEGVYDTLPNDKALANLTLKRVRGGSRTARVEGTLGADLNGKIAAAVKKIVRTPDADLARFQGKATEATLHLERGRELSGFDQIHLMTLINLYQADISDRDEKARQNFHFWQATQALESCLALEPNSAEAKILFGACYESAFQERRGTARKYYREVINSNAPENWRHIAKARLALSWQQEDPTQAVALFKQFEKEAKDPKQAKWFGNWAHSMGAAGGSAIESAKAEVIEELERVEKDLATRKGEWLAINKSPGSVYFHLTNQNERVEKTIAFIQELKPKYPDLFPHMMRDAVQMDGEVEPIRKSFRELLAELKTAPDKMARPRAFYDERFEDAALAVFEKDEALGAEAIALLELAQSKGLAAEVSPRAKIAKGYDLMRQQKWAEALKAFEGAGNRIVEMGRPGPWHCSAFCPTSAMALADHCRARLGIAAPEPGFHREIKEVPLFQTDEGLAMVGDGDNVWVAHKNQLIELGSDRKWKRHTTLDLPQSVSAIAATKDSIYIGTQGAGLVRIDKATLQRTAYRSDDSLLSEHISALTTIGDQLWIGYGHEGLAEWFKDYEGFRWRSDFPREASGGIGMLNLQTRQFTAYPYNREAGSAGLPPNQYPETENETKRLDAYPPNRPILEIASGTNGKIVMAVNARGVQEFDPAGKRWSTTRIFAQCPITSVARSDNYLCAGQLDGRVSNSAERGRSIWIRRNGESAFHFFGLKEGLPHENVTALALEGDTLWIGGFGYVAELNLRENKITKILSVPEREITKLVRNGSTLWLSTNRAVYNVTI